VQPKGRSGPTAQEQVKRLERELDICELRYHALRNAWLQEALELLEPRRMGRPGKQLSTEELLKRVARLESENHQLHEQLHQSQVQLEVARIQAALPGPPKETRRRPPHSPR
jgi:chromosome segregation ATPase